MAPPIFYEGDEALRVLIKKKERERTRTKER